FTFERRASGPLRTQEHGLRFDVRNERTTAVGNVEYFAGFEALEPAADRPLGARAPRAGKFRYEKATGNRGQEIGQSAESAGHDASVARTQGGYVGGSRRSPGDWFEGAQSSSMNGSAKMGKQTGKNICHL